MQRGQRERQAAVRSAVRELGRVGRGRVEEGKRERKREPRHRPPQPRQKVGLGVAELHELGEAVLEHVGGLGGSEGKRGGEGGLRGAGKVR